MYASWRASVSQGEGCGLFLDSHSASEQWFSGALKARSRVAQQEAGVSLEFLSLLAKSLAELNLEGRARSTTTVVAKYLSPAGLLQPSGPSPPAAQHSVSQPQLQLPRTSVDIANPRSSIDIALHPGGVPPDTRASMDARHPHPPHQGRTLTKGSSLSPSLLHGTREARTRLWDLVAPRWCGKPSYYVAHAWSADFVEMLETLIDRVARQPEHKSDKEEDEDADLGSIFVWLDVLALPQQYLGNSTTLDGPIYGPPGMVDLLSVKETVAACERGLVLVLDCNMAILNRVWPLYEVWLAAYYCPSEASTSRVYAAIASNTHVDALLHLQTSCLGGLDLGRCCASRQEDKQQIMTEVRHAAGQKRMQILTSDSILRATRGWLRWSGDPQDLGMYAALMLQSKEYAQLQYVLNAVDEIHDDEATLKEIRDLFDIYDEDGTGSLEEDEFVQVLGMAGFGNEESRSIFRQVDSDGGGSVDLEEFESWWIESQRQQNRQCRPKPELTVTALATNLRGLAAMMQRRNNETSSATITKLAEDLEALNASPKSPFMDGVLPPTEVYGDWRAVANTLGFKITFNDLRPALRMMHGLLLANVDTLALDANPASQLPNPDALGSNARLQKVTLAWFMALMAELLSRNHRTLREADFFLREAIDLSAPEKHETKALSSRCVIDTAIAKARKEMAKNARNDAQMESIVTDMVRLKHGKDTIVSNKLVAEANVSLSTWMASSKGKSCAPSGTKNAKKGHQKPSHNSNSAQVQSVIDFTANYLNSGSTTAVHSGLMVDGSSGSTTAGGGGSSQYAQGQQTSQHKGMYEGRSHAELAHSLGLTCLAAFEELKHGGPLEQEDTGSSGRVGGEEDGEGKAEEEEEEEEEAQTAAERPKDDSELFDRFQQRNVQAADNTPSSPTRRRSLSSSSRPRHIEQSSLERSSRDKLPGLVLPQTPQAPADAAQGLSHSPHRHLLASGCVALLPSMELDPKAPSSHPTPRQAHEGVLPVLQRSSTGSLPELLQGNHSGGHALPSALVPRANHLVADLDGGGGGGSSSRPLVPPMHLPHPPLTQPPSTPSAHPSPHLPLDASGRPTEATRPKAMALLPHPPGAPDNSSKRTQLSESPGSDRGLFSPPWDSRPPHDQHSHTARTGGSSSSREIEQHARTGAFGRSTTTSLSSPRVVDTHASGPQPHAPTTAVHHPTLPLATVGNCFAKHVAAVREQPRISTPMTQPTVTSSDLEALRHRMSMQAGAKTATMATAEASHPPPATAPDASVHRSHGSFSSGSGSMRDLSPCQMLARREGSLRGPSPLAGGPHSSLSSREEATAAAGQQPGCPRSKSSLARHFLEPLPCKLAGKGSRLKMASSSSRPEEEAKGGLSLLSQRTGSATLSSSKWLSHFAGTGLPGLGKTRSHEHI